MPENADLQFAPIIISGLLAFVTAIAVASHQLKKQYTIEKKKKDEEIRLKVLNPLLVASEDLLIRIIDIRGRLADEPNKRKMIHWFNEIDTEKRRDRYAFNFWVNDQGYYALSTLYITAQYFYYASKIRRDFPFLTLLDEDNTALLGHISAVRIAIGGKFGIWENIQDALGSYMGHDDSDRIKNFRQFSEAIIDDKEYVWFNRLIDFYRDIDQKLDDHLDNIEIALKGLEQFLRTNLNLKRTGYKITEDSIKQIKNRDIPEAVIDKLNNLVGKPYLQEADFLAIIVASIGQDAADDYKPSILKCANTRRI